MKNMNKNNTIINNQTPQSKVNKQKHNNFLLLKLIMLIGFAILFILFLPIIFSFWEVTLGQYTIPYAKRLSHLYLYSDEQLPIYKDPALETQLTTLIQKYYQTNNTTIHTLLFVTSKNRDDFLLYRFDLIPRDFYEKYNISLFIPLVRYIPKTRRFNAQEISRVSNKKTDYKMSYTYFGVLKQLAAILDPQLDAAKDYIIVAYILKNSIVSQKDSQTIYIDLNNFNWNPEQPISIKYHLLLPKTPNRVQFIQTFPEAYSKQTNKEIDIDFKQESCSSIMFSNYKHYTFSYTIHSNLFTDPLQAQVIYSGQPFKSDADLEKEVEQIYTIIYWLHIPLQLIGLVILTKIGYKIYKKKFKS